MAEVVLRPSAEADLENIARYTIERWGDTQAESYLSSLRRDIISLGVFPERHPVHKSRHGAFRKLVSGHHRVFYLFDSRTIEVVRVLHERMDVEDRLG